MPLAEVEQKTATIAAAASLSDAIVVGDGEVVGLSVPALDAAALTFQASADGTTYRDLYDSAQVEVSLASSTGGRFIQAPAALKGAAYLKIRSGTSAVPVNQTAQRLIAVVIK